MATLTQRPARSTRLRRAAITISGTILVGAAVAGCSNTPAPINAQYAGAAANATPDGPSVQLRTADINATPPATTIALRSCPTTAAWDQPGEDPWGLICQPLAQLTPGTHVTMECYVSTFTPDSTPGDNSAKWFKVTVVDGPSAGHEGWVWSDLVAHQTLGRPQCASIGHENDPTPAPSPTDSSTPTPSTPQNTGQAVPSVPPATTPAPVDTTPAPVSPTQATPAPPTARQVTVYNEVTNGPTQMREDNTPAYLSSRTQNYCLTNGCELAGTEVSTGATLTAVCQKQGDRTTNGDDNNQVDANNPGRYQSTLWYGIKWSDGTFGYISEVWINPADRGGLQLPNC